MLPLRRPLLAMLLCVPALGAAAPDAELERRAVALSEELRCVVCQNQTIADSQAELAVDLRRQVREKMAEGMSDEQVRTYVVARYGDFVLYRPPLRANTVLLWFGPLLLLAGGMLALYARLRKRPGAPAEEGADPAALARAAALLGEKTP